MKLTKNKYIIWIIGVIIFLLSPQNADLLSDLERLYYSGISYFYIEKYMYAFYSWFFWFLRIFSAFFNARIVRDRSDNPALSFWVPFAIFLPSLSLIINGFMTIEDRKSRRNSMTFAFISIGLIVMGIFISGVIARNKNYNERVINMNAFMEEFETENLDTSIIRKIDLIVSTPDTSDLENYNVLDNDEIRKRVSSKMVPYNVKINLAIKYRSDSTIQYIIESSYSQPAGVAMSTFDNSGKLIMREVHYFYSSLQITEGIKEYYDSDNLIKKEYLRESVNNENADIYEYTLDDERYEFRLYKTTSQFKDYYNFN